MYIEDTELRDIYEVATAERLEKLESALMQLEKQPNDRPSLELFLREAHTLKGDSRMLGVKDVETLIHEMEDCMAAVKRGDKKITSDLCDRLYTGIDAIRKLSREAVTGEKAGVNVFLVLAQLMGAETGENEAIEETSAAEAIAQDTTIFSEANAAPFRPGRATVSDDILFANPVLETTTAQTPVKEREKEINSIRVEAEKLDRIMRHAEELNVTQLRISSRIGEIEQILKLCEETSRDTIVSRSTFNDEERSDLLTRDFHRRIEKRLELLGELVGRLKQDAQEDTTRLSAIAEELGTGVQTLRLLPLSALFNQFTRLVRDLAREQGKQVNLVIDGRETKADKRIIEEMKDPLLHILRNAIDHGIETPNERQSKGKSPAATIVLRGYQSGGSIGIEIVDDGRGLDIDAIEKTALQRGVCSEAELKGMSIVQKQSLIFAPGFSTRTEVSEISGRGIGLDVVRANVERLKGSIQVESAPGWGCEFRVRLSNSIAATEVIIVEVERASYAIPVEFVETMQLISRQEIFAIEGSQTITYQGQPVSVAWLADLLELDLSAPSSLKIANATAKSIPCIILQFGQKRLALLVDELRDRQDIVLKPQSKLLKRVRNITGSTILGNGELCAVLNPEDLLKSVQRKGAIAISRQVEATLTKSKLLLVEDSIIIRTQMKRLLEGAGYDVTIAVDGLEGFNKLRSGNFDAVVSDVEMPNLSGLQLTAKIRQYREYSELPIVLVTPLASEEDKRRGAEAGANAYLTKGDFDQKLLLQTLTRLI